MTDVDGVLALPIGLEVTQVRGVLREGLCPSAFLSGQDRLK